jgi:sugar lactone lactonase YvrE
VTVRGLTAVPVPTPAPGPAEGPFWDARENRLGWVDIARGLLHLLDPVTGDQRTIDAGEPLGAAAPRAAGGYVLATASGFAAVAATGGAPHLLAPVYNDGGRLRMNDGKCDPAGRFWAGSMAYDLTPEAGALHRLEVDGFVTSVLPDVGISNGLDWTPDGTTMYFIDSLRGGVDAFELRGGELSDRRRVVEIENDPTTPQGMSVPDGLTLDSAGCLWVAVFGGESVRRYSTRGELLASIELPGLVPTSCAFGGPDLQDLFITVADAKTPLMVCRPGVSGLPTRAYGG